MVVSTTIPSAQDTFALKGVWDKLDHDSCPRSYNFHMHTVCSDGRLTPEALMQQAVSIGLKGLAITDHHSIRGFYRAQSWLEDARWQQPQATLPHLWTGIEVTSKLEGTEVHILGYAYDPQHPAMQRYLGGDRPLGKDAQAERVIDGIHQAGGLVVLAHPSRYRKPAPKLIPAAARAGVDGVEAFYAYGNPHPWQPSPIQTRLAQQLAQEYNLYTTCGTDTHGANLLRRL